jgi:hypothetical protein
MMVLPGLRLSGNDIALCLIWWRALHTYADDTTLLVSHRVLFLPLFLALFGVSAEEWY